MPEKIRIFPRKLFRRAQFVAQSSPMFCSSYHHRFNGEHNTRALKKRTLSLNRRKPTMKTTTRAIKFPLFVSKITITYQNLIVCAFSYSNVSTAQAQTVVCGIVRSDSLNKQTFPITIFI
jgi:hypothetical protein